MKRFHLQMQRTASKQCSNVTIQIRHERSTVSIHSPLLQGRAVQEHMLNRLFCFPAVSATRIVVGPKSTNVGTNRAMPSSEMSDFCLVLSTELPPRIRSIWLLQLLPHIPAIVGSVPALVPLFDSYAWIVPRGCPQMKTSNSERVPGTLSWRKVTCLVHPVGCIGSCDCIFVI